MAVWTDTMVRERGRPPLGIPCRTLPKPTEYRPPRCRPRPRLLQPAIASTALLTVQRRTVWTRRARVWPPSAAFPCLLCRGQRPLVSEPAMLRLDRNRWHPAAFMWTPDGMSASCCGRLRLCPGSTMQRAMSKCELTALGAIPAVRMCRLNGVWPVSPACTSACRALA